MSEDEEGANGHQMFNMSGQEITLDFFIAETHTNISYKLSSKTPMTPRTVAFVLHIMSKHLALENNIDISQFMYELTPDKHTH
jgi:hypothetical protein